MPYRVEHPIVRTLAAILLLGCASPKAVPVSDPNQATDTGLEVGSLALQGVEFTIAHILAHEEARERIAIALPDGGILVLRIVSAAPVTAADGGP